MLHSAELSPLFSHHNHIKIQMDMLSGILLILIHSSAVPASIDFFFGCFLSSHIHPVLIWYWDKLKQEQSSTAQTDANCRCHVNMLWWNIWRDSPHWIVTSWQTESQLIILKSFLPLLYAWCMCTFANCKQTFASILKLAKSCLKC